MFVCCHVHIMKGFVVSLKYTICIDFDICNATLHVCMHCNLCETLEIVFELNLVISISKESMFVWSL